MVFTFRVQHKKKRLVTILAGLRHFKWKAFISLYTILKINQAGSWLSILGGNGIIMVIPLISKPDESSGKWNRKLTVCHVFVRKITDLKCIFSSFSIFVSQAYFALNYWIKSGKSYLYEKSYVKIWKGVKLDCWLYSTSNIEFQLHNKGKEQVFSF